MNEAANISEKKPSRKSDTVIMLSMLFGLMFVQSFVAPDRSGST